MHRIHDLYWTDKAPSDEDKFCDWLVDTAIMEMIIQHEALEAMMDDSTNMDWYTFYDLTNGNNDLKRLLPKEE
jgi:hypothetical protein